MVVVFELRIDVAVSDENVRPTVVVIIEKASAPAQVFQVEAKFGVERPEAERPVALIAVEVRYVVFEVGLENIEPPIGVVVPGGYTHSGLLAPVLVIPDTRLYAALVKGSVTVIAKEEAGRRITGHVNIGPAAILEVARQHT